MLAPGLCRRDRGCVDVIITKNHQMLAPGLCRRDRGCVDVIITKNHQMLAPGLCRRAPCSRQLRQNCAGEVGTGHAIQVIPSSNGLWRSNTHNDQRAHALGDWVRSEECGTCVLRGCGAQTQRWGLSLWCPASRLKWAATQRSVRSARIWPQKSGLFRVSAAPKPSTLFKECGRTHSRNWTEKFGGHLYWMLPRKMFLGMCIVKMIPSTPRSKVQNEVFPPFVLFFPARPRFRYKQHSRFAYLTRKSGGIAMMNGACHLDKGHKHNLHVLAQTLIRPLLARSWTSRTQHATDARTFFFHFMEVFSMCCLLGSMVGCLLVPCTPENAPVTWSTTTAWIP
jgi:hypothetical protein